ncbi:MULTISPECIES: NAD(+) diphosphatase [Clostridium]|uniref:NAD(+) diphosphatase n=1 Tax=Clostridium TaxID=1485 RepID=UPI0008250933|nr:MULTISPECIES: NUDIX domain-containing protein [Clostridium]PJI08242.1 NUDIX domain-containing protein [Clostridium sp. CT7]
MQYEYCPVCGKKLKKKYSFDEGEVPYCEYDDIMFFDTPKPCIIVAVIRENYILLLEQNYTFKDSKVLVSGYVKNGETIEETVIREVKEEVGIDVKKPEYLGSYYLDSKEIIMITFMAEYSSGEITKSSEVDGAYWVSMKNVLHEMNEDKIGKAVVKKVFKRIGYNK